MKQQKLFDYKEDDTPEWIIEQLKGLGMTYTEMADRMGVNRSTLYRFRKGTYRSPKMKEKILKMYKNPYHGVVLFFIDSTSPRLRGKVYPVVYNEKDLQRQINIDKEKIGGEIIYFKFVKRFTTPMIVRHRSIAFELMISYDAPFAELTDWLIDQIRLMKTQKTRNKVAKLLKGGGETWLI